MCAAVAAGTPAAASTWSPAFDTGFAQPESPGALAITLGPQSLFAFGTSANEPGTFEEYSFASGSTSSQPLGSAHSYTPRVAVNAAGDVVVAWLVIPEDDSAPNEVWAATRPHGGELTAPQRVSAADRSAGVPKVAIGPQGGVVIVFGSSRRKAGRTDEDAFADGFHSIQYVSGQAGGELSAPRRLSRRGIESFGARLGCDDLGRCLVALTTKGRGFASGIDVARIAPSGEAQRPQVLQRRAESPFPQLARLTVEPDGRALVVWKVERPGDFPAAMRLGYARATTAAGAGRARFIRHTPRAGRPAVSLANPARPLIVWQERRAGAWALTSNRGPVIATAEERLRYGAAGVGGRPVIVWSGGEDASDQRLRMAAPSGRHPRTIARPPSPGEFAAFRFREDGHGRLIAIAVSDKTGDEGLVATVVGRDGRPHRPVELARSDPPRNGGFEINSPRLLARGKRFVVLWEQDAFTPPSHRELGRVLESP